jgi:hypothetical protein
VRRARLSAAAINRGLSVSARRCYALTAFSSREVALISPKTPREIVMRISAWAASAMVAIGLVSAAAPVRAQTYDPNFPICMHVIQFETAYEDCTFHTMEQCRASAAGRSAMCSINPFYRGAVAAPGRYERRQRRAY